MLIITLTLVLLIAAWVAAVEGLYPLPGPRPTRLSALTADGWTLAVWHRAAARRLHAPPVVLCHGLANNGAFFDVASPQSLVRYLNERGFDCYTVDLRGAGASSPPHEGPYDVCIDDHIARDIPAVMALVRRHSGQPSALWVGHSLGGLVGLGAASGPLGAQLSGLVTIASPIVFAGGRRYRTLLRLGQWFAPWGTFNTALMRFIAPLARWAPRDVRAATHLGNMTTRVRRLAAANIFAPMWRGVLRQLEDWTWNDALRSEDGAVDYREALRQLAAPILVVGGSVDVLAPEAACRAAVALGRGAPAPRTLALFGRAHGHRSDYGHGDLVLGRSAHLEVYPVIADFLETCAAEAPGVAHRAGSASSSSLDG